MVPARRGSGSVACRRARANALKVASTMWWLFLPASCAHRQPKGGVSKPATAGNTQQAGRR